MRGVLLESIQYSRWTKSIIATGASASVNISPSWKCGETRTRSRGRDFGLALRVTS
jgi:hypothetical protein